MQPVWTYEQFKASLAARFAPPNEGPAACTRLAHLAQAGTVAEYATRFQEVTSLATGNGGGGVLNFQVHSLLGPT